MILNGGPCKKSGREVLREEMFGNNNLIFLINYAIHWDLLSHVLLF